MLYDAGAINSGSTGQDKVFGKVAGAATLEVCGTREAAVRHGTPPHAGVFGQPSECYTVKSD